MTAVAPAPASRVNPITLVAAAMLMSMPAAFDVSTTSSMASLLLVVAAVAVKSAVVEVVVVFYMSKIETRIQK